MNCHLRFSRMLCFATLLISGALSSQHLAVEFGLHESPFNPTGNPPSINGGITYEHALMPWLALSTGAVYSLTIMGEDDTDYCDPPEWSDRCPESLSGVFSMVEIPLLVHVRLFSDEKNISSLNLNVGYGYGITIGSYEEIEYFDETLTSGRLKKFDVANPHIFSAGLEFRHYLSKKVTFALGSRFRYLTDIPGNSTEGMDLEHILFYVKFGLDFSRKK